MHTVLGPRGWPGADVRAGDFEDAFGPGFSVAPAGALTFSISWMSHARASAAEPQPPGPTPMHTVLGPRG